MRMPSWWPLLLLFWFAEFDDMPPPNERGRLLPPPPAEVVLGIASMKCNADDAGGEVTVQKQGGAGVSLPSLPFF